MGSSNPLKDAYYSLEDKWYGFVDALADKVPAIGGMVDSLEDKNIPTFPLAILAIIVIVLLVAYFLTAGASSTLSLIVRDNSGSAIEGASVIVLSAADSTQLADMLSGVDGKVSFSLPNGEYSVKVDKDKYSGKTQSITLNGNTEEEMVLSLEDAMISKAVYLKTAGGLKISGTGSVKYKCSGTNEDEQLATYSNGEFTASVKQSCASVEIISLQNYDLVSTTASFSGNSAITVKLAEVQKGKALVLLQADTNLPAGIRVQLVPADGTLAAEKITTGTNVVNFDDLVVKKYYLLVTDPTGNYVTYDGSKLGITEVKDVLKDQSTTFVATMTKAASASISVTVKDNATKLPVSGAQVKLTSVTNNNDVQTKMTSATGQLVYKVPQNSNYIISAEHPDYFTGETSAATADDTVEVFLGKVDPSKSNSLLVKVTDGTKNPVENARVILKKIDASAEPVVAEKNTDTGGRAEFFNLELGKAYLANVSKEGFGSVNSTTIQIEPRKQSILEVIFDIGTGAIRVKVLGPAKNSLSGVSVKAMNYFSGQQEASSILTNTEGLTEFNIRADKKIYFVVESTAYSKYFTSAIYPQASGVTEKEIVLANKGAPLQAYPIEITSGGQVLAGDGNSSASITQGTYTIKSKLQVPKGTFSEAGLHIRTGQAVNGKINLMEEDGLNISNVYSFGKVTKGTTYTPPSGYGTDQKNLTAGEAKWINSVWKNPQEGTYEIEADITVSETDPNKPLDIYYRGWAKGASVLRDPAATPTQNELYAAAKKRPLALGSGSMCSALGFCKSMSIEPLTGSDIGRKKYVSGTIQAKKDVQYLLTVDLTNFSGKTISGAELNVEGKALEINSLNVNGANQVLGSRVALSPIGVDAPMQVKIIFTPKASGSSAVRLSIIAGSEYKLDETITVNVAQNKTFYLDFVPKVIIPYIANTMFFEAYTDANTSIEGALITIRADGKVLGKTQTTSDGLATYELSGQDIGTAIRITAQKEGYDDIVIDTAVDKALLRITPPSINETIKIGDVKAITTGLSILNSTAKDVKVLNAQINGDMKDYVDVKVIGMENSTIIDSGKDRNYQVSIKLKSVAYNLTAPKDLTGVILINTEVADAGTGFSTELPISIRLSLPGYLDGGKCISVEPAVADFITASAEQSKVITITNNCTAEDTPVALHNLEAKLSEAAKFGTLNISGVGFKSTSLSEKYARVADVLAASAEQEITLTFVPNPSIASGVQSFTVTLSGKNFLDENVEEKVGTQIKATTTMSNLSKCIEVEKPTDGIILDILPWNTGAGMLQNSNYSPYTGGASAYGYGGSLTSANYGGFTQRTAPYNMSYMNGLNMGAYGSSGYGAGYGNTFGGIGQGMNSGTGQGNFTIKNNCAGDVEIQMDVDSRISVGETTFTIAKDSEQNIPVTAGYVLGTYKIKVNGKIVGVDTGKKKVSEVSVKIRRLGDVDTDCISTNMTELNLNSFVQRPQTYAVYNYCYDSGVQLARGNNVATIECSAPDLYSGASSGYGGYGNAYGGMYGPSAYGGSGMYGASGMYGGYGGSGLGNSTGNYYNTYGGSGITSNGCAVQSCSLVAGTRSRNRTVEYENTRSVEKVEFDIMPSAQYNPQAKLFDNRRGSYGLFQNIGSLRSWMTQTDARMNVYGNLNVSYSNQYGSNQCMTFPLTISNIWGLTESIDSAINWGDPNAKPADCQNRNALDIYSYWKTRDPANGGAVPEDRYVNDNYIYQAEPAALRIGAAPSVVSPYYPAYDNYSFINKANETKKTDLGTAKANCGLLDSITVLTKIDPAQTGGAIVTVTSMSSGSLINNTQGANLWVEVNRAGLVPDCLLIQNLPIEGKVSRTINFESAQLSWPLSVLITKNGFKWIDEANKEAEAKARCKIVSVSQIVDCEAKFKVLATAEGLTADNIDQAKLDAILKKIPGCEGKVTLIRAKELLKTTTAQASDCETKTKEYGFSKILTATPSMDKQDVDTYCFNNFCSSQQLQVFILNKVNSINKLALETTNVKGTQLSKLYTAAGTSSIRMCKGDLNFFNGEKGLVLEEGVYKIPDTAFDPDVKNNIKNMTESSITLMSTVLGKLPKEDFNKVLLEVDYNKQYDSAFTGDLGMVKGSNNMYYLSIDRYNELLKKVAENVSAGGDCNTNGSSCTIINWCGTISMKVQPQWVEWMSSHARLRKGVYDRADISLQDQEMVYRQNPKLEKIHILAVFSFARGKYNIDVNKNVFTTKISEFKPLTQGFMEKIITGAKEYPLTFTPASVEIGRYDLELDYVLGGETAKVDVNLNNKTSYEVPAKAVDNVLLKSDLNPSIAPQEVSLSSINRGAIVEDNGVAPLFYLRVPILLTATVQPYETGIVYSPTASTSFSAPKLPYIKWYTTAGTVYGEDVRKDAGPMLTIAQQSTPLTLKGVYYYPNAGELGFRQVNKGASISAKAVAIPAAIKSEIKSITVGPSAWDTIKLIDYQPATMTLDDVIKETGKNACPNDKGDLVWNEAGFIKSN